MQNNISTIGIIALSGEVDKEILNKAIKDLECLGYKIKLSKNIYDKNRYLAGTDEDKIEELHRFFRDTEIDLILCARGGYGAIRLVNKIDYEIIKSNPKPFCGFSDVTALLLMIYKKTGMITYHGPMGVNEDWKYSQQYLLEALSNKSFSLQGSLIYKEGQAEGILWGGNLSTVVSLCGLDFIPDKDFLFFTEDLNEPVYKIDKMFQQLFNIDKFRDKCKGIILGDFLNIDNSEWLTELFKEFSVPTVGGFKITHAKEKITVPIGKNAILRGTTIYIN